MTSSIAARYGTGVAAGRIERDSAQVAVVDMLARLKARLVEHRLARKSSSLGWLFGRRENAEAPKASTFVATSAAARPR